MNEVRMKLRVNPEQRTVTVELKRVSGRLIRDALGRKKGGTLAAIAAYALVSALQGAREDGRWKILEPVLEAFNQVIGVDGEGMGSYEDSDTLSVLVEVPEDEVFLVAANPPDA